jgi:hypothetical protein
MNLLQSEALVEATQHRRQLTLPVLPIPVPSSGSAPNFRFKVDS